MRSPRRLAAPAAQHLIEGTFRHELSGVTYRISQSPDGPRLFYSRDSQPRLSGSQLLEFFVGSNTRGRTFLFTIDGFLYQSPINYYAERHEWDMSPGYAGLRRMELNHPVEETCLFCHASRVQPTVPGTLNAFTGEPFLQPGVGCERCHGPGGPHVRGTGPIVNPVRLQADRRDGICRQCHFEGLARIPRAGRSLRDYRPGDRLSDYAATFVLARAGGQARGAVSQVESLAMSACKRASGDAMSCVTCHDPHAPVPPEQRAAFYRDKCLGCHRTMAATHHGDDDCTRCHMPRRASADIAHTEVTDHRILREPRPADPAPDPDDIRLAELGSTGPDPRELGLAYAEIAPRGGKYGRQAAIRLLTEALERQPADAEVLERLAFATGAAGDLDRAERLYRRALAVEPGRAVSAANLGAILAGRGRLDDAIALWAPAFARNPQDTGLGMDLASGLCMAGQSAAAIEVLDRALRHNPDDERAREMRNRAPFDCRKE